jgi:hypothetical protein
MTDEQQEIIDAFMSDFTELLRHYNATIDAYNDSHGVMVDIDFSPIYDENKNLVRPYINFQLPNYINPNR